FGHGAIATLYHAGCRDHDCSTGYFSGELFLEHLQGPHCRAEPVELYHVGVDTPFTPARAWLWREQARGQSRPLRVQRAWNENGLPAPECASHPWKLSPI